MWQYVLKSKILNRKKKKIRNVVFLNFQLPTTNPIRQYVKFPSFQFLSCG